MSNPISTPKSATTARESTHTGVSDRIAILHVDDEPEFAELAAAFIRRQDERFAIDTATSASEGLDRLSNNHYDCIVSDFDMPGQNGIEFLKTVRENDPDIPFILYTGKGSEEVASEAISAGVTEYLQKETGTSQYKVLVNRIQNAVERYRAHETAAETEQRLQTIAANTNDILWKFTADWNELLFINSPYEEIWGRSIDELRERPQSFLEGIHPEDRELVKEAMGELSAGEAVDIEYRVNSDEDFGRWVWVQGKPVFDDSGDVTKVVGFARDITDRKERERELEQLKDRFQAFTELASDVITVIDENGRIQYESPSVERVLGYTPDELIGTSAFEHVHPDDREVVMDTFESVTGSPGSAIDRAEYRFKHADGSWIWLESVGSNRTDTAINGYVITSREVTDRKDRERELRETKSRLETALSEQERHLDAFDEFLDIATDSKRSFDEQLRDVLALGVDYLDLDIGILAKIDPPDYSVQQVVTPDGSIEPGAQFDLSETFCELVYEADGPVAFHTPADGEVEDHPAYRDLGLESYIGEPLGLDGSRYGTLNFSSPSQRQQPFTDGERAFVRTLAEWVSNEVRRHEHEQEVRDLEAKFRSITEDVLDATEVGLFILDSEFEVAWCNETTEDFFGIDRDDVIGRGKRQVIAKEITDVLEDPDRFAETVQGTYADNTYTERFECHVLPGEGRTERWLGHLSHPIETGFFEGGRVEIYTDITDRKEREQELERQNARLDEFASIISHDLRNPLSVAAGRLELVRDEHDSEDLHAAIRALERMEVLIDDVMELARSGADSPDPQSIRISEVVEENWRGSTPDSVKTVVTMDRAIQADRSQLDQLLANLIMNAAEHGGSDVTVTIGELSDGFYVEDDGPGIPIDEREKIFETGYSSKSDGTGYGLSVVKQVVEAHSWEVTVTEGQEGGARFEFRGVQLS